MKIKQLAVIWDMDGVLIDSVPYHHLAWQEAFRARGVEFTTPVSDKPFGHLETIRSVLINPSQHDVAEISQHKERAFKRLIVEGGIRPLKGVMGLLTGLRKAHFKQALASATSRAMVFQIIETIGIKEYFDEIICAEDVSAPKPDPEAFSLALSKMKMSAADTCVLEDMPAGIIAAQQRGIHTIGIATNHSRKTLSMADLVVESPVDLDARIITSLITGAPGA